MALFEDTLSDTTNLTPSTLGGWIGGVVATDTTNLTPSAGVTWRGAGIAIDQIIASERLLDPARAYAVVAADGLTVEPIIAESWHVDIREPLALTELYISSTSYQLTLAQSMRLQDASRSGLGIAAVDGLVVTPAASTAVALGVADAVGVAVMLAPTTTYGVAVTSGVVLTDSLRRFLDGTILDPLVVAGTDLPSWRITSMAADTISVTPTLSQSLILRLVAADGIDVTPAMALQMLYKPTLADGIEISAAYLSPGDTLVTWVINTVNGATTEYTNFDFNSFAAMGSRYVGASSTGLYALDGDTDDGTDVIAQIKSGLMQMTMARFTSFRGAYIATTTNAAGASKFILKLVTGDGEERTYRVNVRDNETTKIHLGRGLRARFLSFELTSTGQDFDLSSLEFVPIVSSRRV